MNEKKIIFHARAKKNGIIFYSNSNSLIGCDTFFDETGEIKTRIVLTNIDEFIDNLGALQNSKSLFNKKRILCIDIAVMLLSIILSILFGNHGLMTAGFYFAGFLSFDLFKFIDIAYSVKFNKNDNGVTSKFHAAEHMVLNAYQKLQKIPTLDEIKGFSRFSKYCGSRKMLSAIFLFSMCTLSLAFLATFFPICHIIVTSSTLIFYLFDKKYGWLSFLQVFITSKPSDKELTLAIEGLKQFEIMEEKIKNDDEILKEITFPEIPEGLFEPIDSE